MFRHGWPQPRSQKTGSCADQQPAGKPLDQAWQLVWQQLGSAARAPTQALESAREAVQRLQHGFSAADDSEHSFRHRQPAPALASLSAMMLRQRQQPRDAGTVRCLKTVVTSTEQTGFD